MAGTMVCRICGNEIDGTGLTCPFCGCKQESLPIRPAPDCRVVNLEKGMPTVSQALERLDNEMAMIPAGEPRALILIHGYGSSGRGGAIRQEVRRHLIGNSRLKELLFGEKIDRRSGRCRLLAGRFPCLRPYLRRANPGITLVVV